jgi:hypothetical protein
MTLLTLFPQCQDLQVQVEAILQLLQQEPNLRSQQDGSVVQSSVRKAIAPKSINFYRSHLTYISI